MSITFEAVYEGGVLRPKNALPLPDGETVQVTIAAAPIVRSSPPSFLRPPTPEEEDYARRLSVCKNLQEMFAVMETAPPFPEGYDLIKALNDNRRETGERLLYPEEDEGVAS